MLASVHEVDVHEVDSARRTNKARACSMSVCCERGRKRRWMRCTARMGRLRILPSLRRQSSRKPYNISENHTNSKKIPEQYHLPPDGYKFHRISPDFTGPLQVTP